LRRLRKKALEKFLIHGVNVFPADIGSMTSGILTAYASPSFKNNISYNAHHQPERIRGESKIIVARNVD
jgi:hypothetical protein